MSGLVVRHAIRAILLTPQDDVLLLRIVLPGLDPFWIAPGGGREDGETPEACLRRELREELGLPDCDPGALVWRRQHSFDWRGRRFCQTEEYRVVRVARFDPVMGDDSERETLDRFHWWPLAELATAHERLTPLSLADIVTRYLRDGPPDPVPAMEILVD